MIAARSQEGILGERVRLLDLAVEFLKTNRNNALADRVQVALGYLELSEQQPWNQRYRLKLRLAMDDLTQAVGGRRVQ